MLLVSSIATTIYKLKLHWTTTIKTEWNRFYNNIFSLTVENLIFSWVEFLILKIVRRKISVSIKMDKWFVLPKLQNVYVVSCVLSIPTYILSLFRLLTKSTLLLKDKIYTLRFQTKSHQNIIQKFFFDVVTVLRFNENWQKYVNLITTIYNICFQEIKLLQ